jgi:hypothetical protein
MEIYLKKSQVKIFWLLVISFFSIFCIYYLGLAPLTWSNAYGDFTWNYSTIPQTGALNRKFKWPGNLFHYSNKSF